MQPQLFYGRFVCIVYILLKEILVMLNYDNLFNNLSIYLSIYLSIHLSNNLSIYLSIYEQETGDKLKEGDRISQEALYLMAEPNKQQDNQKLVAVEVWEDEPYERTEIQKVIDTNIGFLSIALNNFASFFVLSDWFMASYLYCYCSSNYCDSNSFCS